MSSLVHGLSCLDKNKKIMYRLKKNPEKIIHLKYQMGMQPSCRKANIMQTFKQKTDFQFIVILGITPCQRIQEHTRDSTIHQQAYCARKQFHLVFQQSS